MIPDLNYPVLYACVVHGATVLAELVHGGGGGGDVAAVARRCLAAAPPFHREYSHTAGGRIYAFAMADPLVFFAIADASLGAPRAFFFLRRLHRSAAGAAAAPLSLQSLLLPELRRLALALPDEVDDPPPPSPSPSSSPPPPPTPLSPLNEANNEPPMPGTEEEKKRKKKKKKKKKKKHPLDGGDGAMEISVAADAADPLPKSMHIAWRRHLRAILLVDLAVGGLLFGIWISVCKGFHCIRRLEDESVEQYASKRANKVKLLPCIREMLHTPPS